MDKFNWSRVGLLLRMEWVKNQKFFVAFWILVSVGIFIGMAYLNFTIVKFVITNPSKEFAIYYMFFGFISWVIYASFSFKDFHKRGITIEYLQLPANLAEKFFSKLLVYIILFPVFYSIVYFLSINLSIYISDTINVTYLSVESFNSSSLGEVKPFNFLTIGRVIKMLSEGDNLLAMSFYIVLLSVISSFSFFSSQIFRRFNLLFTVLFSITYLLFCVTILVIASHILLPDQTSGFDIAFKDDFILFKELNLPLSGFILMVTFLVSPIVFLSASYFRLKEKEI